MAAPGIEPGTSGSAARKSGISKPTKKKKKNMC
jgi:hypothetical protein